MHRLPRGIDRFAVATDLVVLTVRGGRLQVLLIRRGIAPYEKALPGGFLREDESLDECAVRELREETSIDLDAVHVEQLGTYGRPDRDDRGRVISVAYLALMPDPPVPVGGTDARSAEWLPYTKAGRLAFDHKTILGDGVERARAKLEYSSLATAFCPETFTMAELRAVYEAVWGKTLDPGNFQRKVRKTEDFVTPTGERTTRGGGRPAELFRAGRATTLTPPLIR